jgi:hypothetical protein
MSDRVGMRNGDGVCNDRPDFSQNLIDWATALRQDVPTQQGSKFRRALSAVWLSWEGI